MIRCTEWNFSKLHEETVEIARIDVRTTNIDIQAYQAYKVVYTKRNRYFYISLESCRAKILSFSLFFNIIFNIIQYNFCLCIHVYWFYFMMLCLINCMHFDIFILHAIWFKKYIYFMNKQIWYFLSKNRGKVNITIQHNRRMTIDFTMKLKILWWKSHFFITRSVFDVRRVYFCRSERG